jgi:predicted TIM-barrel fold metal-dependent hydrolase
MPDTSARANSEKDRTKKKPNFTVPPLACDTHFHVFGLPEHYPYGPELRYIPPIALLSEYLTLSEQLNIERMVFVQPSAYGKDNTCMLDAMAKMGERCRGIVDIEENTPEQEFERFHAIGVRGIRINVAPIKSYEAGFAEKIIAWVKPLAKRIKTFGWHLQFLSPGWLVNELIPTLEKLPVPFVIDHMGLFPAEKGIEQPGFQKLLRLLGEGNCWVKLTGVYRMSSSLPDFNDAVPFAKALIAAAPDRILWGSDFPHLSYHDKVNSFDLFNLLSIWAPDEHQRQKILVDNPRHLFEFN